MRFSLNLFTVVTIAILGSLASRANALFPTRPPSMCSSSCTQGGGQDCSTYEQHTYKNAYEPQDGGYYPYVESTEGGGSKFFGKVGELYAAVYRNSHSQLPRFHIYVQNPQPVTPTSDPIKSYIFRVRIKATTNFPAMTKYYEVHNGDDLTCQFANPDSFKGINLIQYAIVQ